MIERGLQTNFLGQQHAVAEHVAAHRLDDHERRGLGGDALVERGDGRAVLRERVEQLPVVLLLLRRKDARELRERGGRLPLRMRVLVREHRQQRPTQLCTYRTIIWIHFVR